MFQNEKLVKNTDTNWCPQETLKSGGKKEVEFFHIFSSCTFSGISLPSSRLLTQEKGLSPFFLFTFLIISSFGLSLSEKMDSFHLLLHPTNRRIGSTRFLLFGLIIFSVQLTSLARAKEVTLLGKGIQCVLIRISLGNRKKI